MACFWDNPIGAIETGCDAIYVLSFSASVAETLGYSRSSENGTCTPEGESWPQSESLYVWQYNAEDDYTLIGAVDSYTLEVLSTTVDGVSDPGPGFTYAAPSTNVLTVSALLECPSCEEQTIDTIEVTAQTPVGEVVTTMTVAFHKPCF